MAAHGMFVGTYLHISQSEHIRSSLEARLSVHKRTPLPKRFQELVEHLGQHHNASGHEKPSTIVVAAHLRMMTSAGFVE